MIAERYGLDRRHAVHVGVAGAVLMFIVLGTLHALSTPLLLPSDEASHVAYALRVAEGHLPDIWDVAPEGSGLRRLEGRQVWVANHPPLYYLLVARVLDAASGSLQGGLYAARLVGVLFTAGALILVAWFARLLVPGSPTTAVVATASAGLLGSLPHVTGLVFNDSLAMLTSMGALVSGFLILRRGATVPRLLALAVTCSAALLTRFSGGIAVAAAVSAAAYGIWRRTTRDQGYASRFVRTSRLLAPPVLATVASSGWFYLRNHRLYGDITGAQALFELFDRTPRGTVPGIISDVDFWILLHDQLWGRLAGGNYLQGWTVPVARSLTVLAAAGLLLALVQHRGRRPEATTVVGWLIGAGFVLVLVASVAVFHARGGSAHARYLFPGLGVIGVAAGLGFQTIARRRRWFLLVAGAACTVMLDLVLWHRFLVTRASFDVEGFAAAETAALSSAGFPATPILWSAAILLAIGGAAWAASLWRLRSTARPPDPLGHES